MAYLQGMSKNHFFYKLKHWEYWPSFMFYVPNVPLAVYLALKAKNLVFYSAVNPGMYNSGNGMESKFDTLKLIPKHLRPKSVLVVENMPFTDVKNLLIQQEIAYPLIAKPDIGFRGLLVKKIDNEQQLKAYLNRYSIKIIIQEYIDLPNECGIFYYRLPNQQKGCITSITLKEFLKVKGDGVHSIRELISKDKRATLYTDLLKGLHGDALESVLSKNDFYILNTIGNHCKGTRFVDGNRLITRQLENSLDQINKQIDGWYYGRIDIKYTDFADIEAGKDFNILEINGIISEPTHIYDATSQNYFKAVKTIANHWKIIYKIGTINHTILHFPYTKASAFLKDMKTMKKYIKKLNGLAR